MNTTFLQQLLAKRALAKRQHPFILVALTLLLTAIGPVARAAEFQKGSYSAVLPRGDKVTLLFDDNGKFTLKKEDGKVLVAGTYKVTKTQIEFTDETGPLAAKDAKPGKYEWKLESGKLTFSIVEDESQGRSNGLTRPTWTAQK